LSADGRALAGTGAFADAGWHRVYRWTPEGLSWLGPDDASSRFVDMTADGAMLLGMLVDTRQGFIASANELRMLSEMIATTSVDLRGWQLESRWASPTMAALCSAPRPAARSARVWLRFRPT
jgi:hypothetical protein